MLDSRNEASPAPDPRRDSWFSSPCASGSQRCPRRSSGPTRRTLRVHVLTRGLDHPWSLAFLPDGRMLVSERRGRLRLVAADGALDPVPITGLPENVTASGQGGLMDVALHPDFANNRLVYLAYTGSGDGGLGTELARGRLEGKGLVDTQVLFRALPKSGGGRHFGGRIVFRW